MNQFNRSNSWTAEFEAVRRQRSEPDERGGPDERGERGGRGGHPGHGGHGGRGGRGGRGGPPPWVGQLFGPGGFGPGMGPDWGRGPGRGDRRRGPRVRRGDVRAAILDVLGEGQLNGYQVIQGIAERTDDAWKPSPGSVYPTIAQLEDEGLLETVVLDGKKTLQLTAEGSEYVADHTEEMAAVWRPFAEDKAQDDGDTANLKPLIGQMMGAVWQIAVSGTPDQQSQAATILADARRRLYGVLADGPDADADVPEEE